MVIFNFMLNRIPHLIYANDVNNLSFDFKHFRRKPTEYVLFFVVDGVLCIEEDGVQYELKKGDYIILDPSRTHDGFKGSPAHYYYVHFTWEGAFESNLSEEEYVSLAEKMRRTASGMIQYENPAEETILIPKHMELNPADYDRNKAYFDELKLFYHEMLEYYHVKTGACLIEFFVSLCRSIDNSLMNSDLLLSNRSMIEILSYLKSHYAEQIKSEDIEKHMNGNFDYLNRQFRKYTGTTIFKYLNDYRIQQSKDMLQSGNFTLNEIASTNGFSNEYYYSRVFKKITGKSPRDYRNGFLKDD